MRLKEINVSGFIKSVLFFSLLFISCKEYPILHQFESETDVPIREYINNFENKVFYAYSTEKDAYIIDNVDKNIPINFSERLGYWKLSDGKITSILPEDIVQEIHGKLLFNGELKTGGFLVVKFHSNGNLMEK
ncbi:hypothetical protein [Cyclobacterium sp.]|uniref:hypothetical protein n=1 Tax=Cyclobacterium sp. TaxID=1966343 RepID=UPI0019AF0ED1|nr:hypothetical protein [Cyclobacterium sp.]MBD3628851.1 hypothetical protein [Cyclobacterium sp.]